MNRIIFTVPDGTDLMDVEQTLQLAFVCIECLAGITRVRAETAYHADEKNRRFIIDATTATGRDVVTLFLGLLVYEFPDVAIKMDKTR